MSAGRMENRSKTNRLTSQPRLRLVDPLDEGVSPAVVDPLASIQPFLMPKPVLSNVAVLTHMF
jgi:hypothetical protein